MGVTEDLAELVVQARYDDLTPEMKELSRWAMMDGAATTLAARVEPAGRIIGDLVQQLGAFRPRLCSATASERHLSGPHMLTE